jgi:membrane protein implicated in regulation of membrane protease activity
MDSGSRTGLGLLAIGVAAVIALMLKLRGHMLFEVVLGVFLVLQIVNAVLIVRSADRK